MTGKARGRPKIPDFYKKTSRYQIGFDAMTGFKLHEYARMKGQDVTQFIETTMAQLVDKKEPKMLQQLIDELSSIPDKKTIVEEECAQELLLIDEKINDEQKLLETRRTVQKQSIVVIKTEKMKQLEQEEERLKQKIKALKAKTKERGKDDDDKKKEDKRRTDDEEVKRILSKS